ncbi:hypothetical protein POM88_015223 [Heracleum sosnowskyi]|uniref:Uncharacterized protein n=1 Tax=Heracleum sosnowskyi TaxID=360622 RepID=A0AAD8MRU2_9APIA|nr:hypothetical protein POM88_015223 [Heracleum sosnowskyi]
MQLLEKSFLATKIKELNDYASSAGTIICIDKNDKKCCRNKKSINVYPLNRRLYAEAAVKCIGYEIRCSPYWAHAVQWFFVSLLPDFGLDSWRYSVGIRRSYLV